jgi:hypothetical protein
MPNFSSVSARKPACGSRIETGLMGKLLFYRGGDAQNFGEPISPQLLFLIVRHGRVIFCNARTAALLFLVSQVPEEGVGAGASRGDRI